jgi:hypothetical protein
MHTLQQLRSGALAGTRRLDLACGLTDLPEEVFDLTDTLEVLNLSGNRRAYRAPIGTGFSVLGPSLFVCRTASTAHCGRCG